MSQTKCSACGCELTAGQGTCERCGAPVTEGKWTPEALAQLQRINAAVAALKDDLQEFQTPVRTTSFNGCGLMLLDYRPVGEGLYEASRFVTLFGFPLLPLSVWKIRPRRYTHDARGERQSFDLVGKRRLTLERLLRPYLWLALGALPFVLAYYFADLRPVVYGIGRALGSWAAVGLIILLIICVLVWVGYIMSRFHNAGTAYKHLES